MGRAKRQRKEWRAIDAHEVRLAEIRVFYMYNIFVCRYLLSEGNERGG